MNRQDILNEILVAIQEVSPIGSDLLIENHPKPDTCFVDYGVNSIDYAYVTTLVMEKLGIDRPLDDFIHTNRIFGVVDMLAGDLQVA
ncbi:MAG: hypothetical protein COA42_10325 [Alteromonadaceae bacterium]|nr:MAG: hypothetical protein COA42_10325 [Alteromonadaceae bacterium]